MIRRISSYSSTYSSNLIEDNFRNFIINGDFRINQRSFTSSTTTSTFGFDRWFQTNSGGTVTVSTQNLTLGSPPQAGYESTSHIRIVTSGQSAAGDVAYISQRIEDVRSLAGSDVTLSFWAKAATGTPKIGIEFIQEMGTGGTPSANVSIVAGSVTIGTSWERYIIKTSIPNLSGKTLGTNLNSSLRLNIWVSSGTTNNASAGNIGIQNNTFDIWGVQLERGTFATNFEQTSIADELGLCRRYYFRFAAGAAGNRYGVGLANSAASSQIHISFLTTMRAAPTAVETTASAADYTATHASGTNSALSAVPTFAASSINASMLVFTTASAFTTGNVVIARANSSTSYLGWSAEF